MYGTKLENAITYELYKLFIQTFLRLEQIKHVCNLLPCAASSDMKKSMK